MADYQIDCATRADHTRCPQRHITEVRIADVVWTIDDIFVGATLGHAFHTVDPRTGQRTNVVFYECSSGHPSIRSACDEAASHNLLNLPCR